VNASKLNELTLNGYRNCYREQEKVMAGQQVEVEIDGRKYTGWYEVSAQRVLTVTTSNGRKSTQLGGSTQLGLAQMLLRELVREGKA
jgi:hypothetical protein